MRKFRLLLLVGFCVVFSAVIFAQDIEDPCGWGFVFNMKKDFTVGKVNLGTYNNGASEIPVLGIGVEKFLNNKWSIIGDLSVGIGDSSQEGDNENASLSQTELGFKVGANYYFQGIKKTISPYVGLWTSYISFSETQTFEPRNGTKQENEFSSSTFGIGVTGGAYFNPWDDIGLSIGAGYNLGYFTTPASTIKNTIGSNTTEFEGPSMSKFTDCGGQLMVRYSF